MILDELEARANELFDDELGDLERSEATNVGRSAAILADLIVYLRGQPQTDFDSLRAELFRATRQAEDYRVMGKAQEKELRSARAEIARLCKEVEAYDRALMAWLFYAEACSEGLPGLDKRLDDALALVKMLPGKDRTKLADERFESVAIRQMGGCGAIDGVKPNEQGCILPLGHDGLHGWDVEDSSVLPRQNYDSR